MLSVAPTFLQRVCATTNALFSVALWLSLAIWPSVTYAQGQDPQLDQAMAAELKRQGLAGAVWSLIDVDGNVSTHAAGLRDAPSGKPMTPQTRVNIGSVTKTLIATGALQLVTRGKLDLDAPVEPYLSGLRFENPWRDTHPVTLRHLLDHTAGLDDTRLWQMFSLKAKPETPLREAFTRDPTVLAVRNRPGERFSYSNMGYTLAAMAIESATGERYETWLDRELLAPLGMRDSTFRMVEQTSAEGADLAWGHLDDLQPFGTSAVWLRPASQFTTSALDMARFAQFLLSDGRVDGRVLVDKVLLHAMGHPRDTTAARAGLRAGYALGMARQERQGVDSICHSGNIVGFHAMLCLYPQEGKAFFVALNSDAETAEYGRFDGLLVRALQVQPPARSATVANAPAPDAWQGTFVIDPSRFQAFRYLDLLTNTVDLDAGDKGTLKLTPFGGDTRALTLVDTGQADGVLAGVGGTAQGLKAGRKTAVERSDASDTHAKPITGSSQAGALPPRAAEGPSPATLRLYAAEDRLRPSHVLLQDEEGRLSISDGYKTFTRIATPAWWALWLNLVLGAAGLLWFLLVAPWRLRNTRKAHRPIAGALAAWLLVVPGPLFALQSMMAMGDRTPASITLYIATALLAPLMLWQLWSSVVARKTSRWAPADAVAACAVLQWCVVLAAWRVLPFALWS